MTTLNLRELIAAYGLDPKKSLGQNYLADEGHLQRIVDAAALTPNDTVLEIGPGLGILTSYLGMQAGRVVAVELDDRLIPVLRGQFATQDHVQIVHGDILDHDPADLLQLTIDNSQLSIVNYKVVANLPYYITSAVLRHILEARTQPSMAVVTVQREVAERICAEPGDMSILAVSVQFYARPQLVHHVPAAAFYPRPNVDSAVLRLDVHLQPAVAGVESQRFFHIVRAGFGQKRKQLRNSLSAGLGLAKTTIDERLYSVDIDSKRRAQTLSVAEWGRIYHSLGASHVEDELTCERPPHLDA